MEEARYKGLKELENTLFLKFENISLLDQALTHKSFANEIKTGSILDNERLEFLGDAVLNLVIGHLLIQKFPDQPEGILSKIRAVLVNKQCFSNIAKSLKLGDYLRLGKGEELTKGREKDSILAGAYESLVASVYLDGGYERAFQVISQHFSSLLAEVSKEGFFQDFKSELQEYTQTVFKVIPEYLVVKESGPNHHKEFEINILINKQIWGEGKGRSKKEAEQKAAQNTLEKLKKTFSLMKP